MPFENLCTNNVSRSRFEKWTVQSVDANVEKGPLCATAGNTSSGAVYSQTKTVRHGMRAAIVGVRATERCGRVDSARRGDTNACAAAKAATRMRRAILVVSELGDVSMCCFDTYLRGSTPRVASGSKQRVASALRWDCFTRARSALEGLARCKDFTEAVRNRSVRTVARPTALFTPGRASADGANSTRIATRLLKRGEQIANSALSQRGSQHRCKAARQGRIDIDSSSTALI